MEYTEDKRIVMTLDAGGTNFVFSAIRGGAEIVRPITLPACADDLARCLWQLLAGFDQVRAALPAPPDAISFAFPGPADYAAGIIGDLPNFPAFRGGVALGPFLEAHFEIPVFINNDGSLFAYGEALAGVLPEVNRRLAAAGSRKCYRNLLGITLGTGLGAGVVIDGRLLVGDNGSGGSLWCLRNKKYPDCIVEESVSIRAVKRVYAERSGCLDVLSPKAIFEIAEGLRAGDRQAAVAAFAELGELAGDAIATAATLVDGLVVIGGGLAGASKYILPALLTEMRSSLALMDGRRFSRLPAEVYDLDDAAAFARFAQAADKQIPIPGTGRHVTYDVSRRIGVAVSPTGASHSIAMGAYLFALNALNRSNR